MNLDQNIYSKESVKARMLQNATKIWGVKSPQSLDPFVKLLIDAFSTEIFKTNNEVQSVNSRILEKLSKLLTPNIYTHPFPAHAIAFVNPTEMSEKLWEHTEFFFKKTISSSVKGESDRQVSIPFTPIDSVVLNKLQTSVMIVGNNCYGIDEKLNKIPMGRFQGKIDDYRKITIGIDASQLKSEKFPKHLSLYCSNPSFEHLDYVFKLLPFTEITSNGNPIAVRGGLSYEKNVSYQGYEEIFNEQSIRTKVKASLKNVYEQKFIEITGLTDKLLLENVLPEEIQHLSDQESLQNFVSGKNMLWLTIKFPPQFTAEILDNFSFILNAFPVYNRGWKKTEYSLDVMGNNIPLITDVGEHFLYVDEVQDGDGNYYQEIPFTPNDLLKKGLYTVRKGGMERFNNRNAVDMIANVLELTRDEITAFSLLNRDNVKTVLNEISGQMKTMMQKINNVRQNTRQDFNYVILEPLENSRHTFAAFWYTNCNLANQMRPGTELSNQKKSQFMTLLTETLGGAEEQTGTDSIQAFKFALTSTDKIITIQDVKNYCEMVLKDELKEIRVSRGTMISSKPKEGFIRTVQIQIIPQNYAFYGKRYWDNMAGVLRNQIISRAIDGLEYILEVKDEDDLLN